VPFKSHAQKRKFRELEAQGKLAPGTTAKWETETPKGYLPSRVKKAPKKKGVRIIGGKK
jgi:hypothetical protein